MPVFKTGAINQTLPPLQIGFSVKKFGRNLDVLTYISAQEK
tara:strand:+ start:11809 stop:11931 length:123 start_codon:yes stop_codon:yes gene_type:complete